MNETIARFLQHQTCASICCVDEGASPYCFSCYYAFDSEKGLLYFKSSIGSHHMELLKDNPNIAGTVLPDKLNRLLVKGVQFEGVILEPGDHLAGQASIHYHKKFPMGLLIPGETRVIRINSIKMTDSTKGFGKKITWSRSELERVMASL